MKTTNRFFKAITALLLLVCVTSFAQENKPPMYVTVTTMYWNLDNDASNEDWAATEKEYLEKVTKKNQHISGASFHSHLITANSSEVIYVQTYPSWEDIDKAGARNSELEKEAWPDEAARKAFLDKQAAFYSMDHSDEIFATMSGAKFMPESPDKDMVLYLRKSKMDFPEDGSMKEFEALRKKQFDNVINKNEYIKAYYPNQHAWGTDRRDFVEAFIIDSLDDLKKMFDRSAELGKDVFSEDEMKAMGKYFTGVHGDYVYTSLKL